jgi:hypothetical protein
VLLQPGERHGDVLGPHLVRDDPTTRGTSATFFRPCRWVVVELQMSTRLSQRGQTSMRRRGAKYVCAMCQASGGNSARSRGSSRSSSW